MNRVLSFLLALAILSMLKVAYDKSVIAQHLLEEQGLVQELKDEIRLKEELHSSQAAKFANDLERLRKSHETVVTDIHNEYTGRVHEHEQRTAYYRRLSEASTTECRDLSDITARFDRHLEEGRYLVKELRERLVLREEQIRIIGQQLLIDRQLTGAEELNENR